MRDREIQNAHKDKERVRVKQVQARKRKGQRKKKERKRDIYTLLADDVECDGVDEAAEEGARDDAVQKTEAEQSHRQKK